MRKILTPLSLLLLTACATHINGRVVGPDGAPVTAGQGKVNIMRLTDAGQSPKSQVLDIDKNGQFKTETDLETGDYLIEPLIPNYKGGSLKIHVKASQDVVLNVVPIERPKAATIDANIDVEMSRGAGQTTLTPPQL